VPSAHGVHWTYGGDAGPAHWGSLDSSFAACGNGARQSPIDLANAAPADLPNIVFHYQPSNLRVVNNGHTVQVNYDPGSFIEVGGKRYDLQQFHFHAPSEHAVNGASLAAEMHLVHIAADGQPGVVAILLAHGEENPALKEVWNALPKAPGPEVAPGTRVNAAAMLPQDPGTFRYIGSLTTPPCTEGVAWLVMTRPMPIGMTQVDAFRNIFEPNNRPLQRTAGRELVEDTSK
jgi:carbonic anhydrase